MFRVLLRVLLKGASDSQLGLLVTRILDTFPGASIDEIKTPETVTTDITASSDDALLRANADDKEMSG